MPTSTLRTEGSPPTSELQARVLDYLRRHHTLSLATDGPAGLWAATVFYVNAAFDIYFRSRASTRHVRNLLANPRVAATISRDAEDWRDIQGVQLEGVVDPLTDPTERMRAYETFLKRFPFVESLWGGETSHGADPQAARLLFRIRPERILFLDHEYATERLELSGKELRAKPG